TVLTVSDEIATTNELSICEGESITIGTNTYSASGTYTDTFTSVSGCDSIITTVLTIVNEIQFSQILEICTGEEIVVGSSIYDMDGIYIDILTATSGCDSIVTTTIIVYAEFLIVDDMVICEGEEYEVETSVYTISGQYIDSLSTINGCDSIIITNLTVLDVFNEVETINLCNGSTIELNGELITESGVHTNTYTSQNGCDSIITTDVIISDEIEIDVVMEMCEGEAANSGVEAGIYTDVFISYYGCDSIVNTEIIVYDNFNETIDYDVCDNDSLLISGIWYEAGFYTETYLSLGGCDSIINYNIQSITSFESIDSISICDGEIAYYGTTAISDAGWHTINLQTATSGCDSILNIFVTIIGDPLLEVEGGEICLGESIELISNTEANIHWSPAYKLSCVDCPNPIATPAETTTYTATIVGCRGEIISATATVVVNQVPVIEIDIEDGLTTIVAGRSVKILATAYPFAYTYQWIDDMGNVICDDCREITVSPMSTIIYTVIVTNTNGCTAEASIQLKVNNDCSIGELIIPNIISPNGDGRNDELVIQYGSLASLDLLRIYNRWGQLVYETKDVSKYWNGTFRGKVLNTGVYTYYFKGECLNGNEFIRTGNVTLLD
ncbi:MAG: gliding motility-associated-like protein, partial [Maribacter sp.]